MALRLAILGFVLGIAVGCGTTRWTDTARTATEQLLISDSMDRAVSRIDLRALAGRKVFLDTTPLNEVTDHAYLVSTLRQHLLASGCILKDAREEAEYVVEARVGTVGTDKRELMFGVPAVTVPTTGVVSAVPSSIPEIPFVKRTEQRAVTKIALFAYNTKTGRPVWQSGTVPVESTAKDIWVFGAGPFQRGSIYNGTKLAGNPLNLPLVEPGENVDGDAADEVQVADEAFFTEKAGVLAENEKKPTAPDAAVADVKTETPKGSTEPKKDGEVLPAQHASSGNPSLPAQTNLVAPWPTEERPEQPPRLITAPENAAPVPSDLYPMLGIPGPRPSEPPSSTNAPIDPSLIFDP